MGKQAVGAQRPAAVRLGRARPGHLLGYTASQTLEFLFLDQDMDLHREQMIEFGKLALRYTDPALRW